MNQFHKIITLSKFKLMYRMVIEYNEKKLKDAKSTQTLVSYEEMYYILKGTLQNYLI